MVGAADAFGVEAPIPGLEGAVEPLPSRDFQEPLRLDGDLALGGGPDLVEQALHRGGRAGHGVGQAEGGEVVIAQERGPFLTERQDLGDQHAVVVFAGVAAALDPRGVGDPAQVATLAEGQEGLYQRAGEGDDVTRQAALSCGGGGAFAHEGGEAGHVGFRQRERPCLLVVQHVLAEGGVERGDAHGDGGEALLGRLVEGGAAPDVAEVGALEQAHLVRIEA